MRFGATESGFWVSRDRGKTVFYSDSWDVTATIGSVHDGTTQAERFAIKPTSRLLLLSPDKRMVAVAGRESGAVSLLDAGSGRELVRAKGLTAVTESLAFSRDGKSLAGADDQGRVCVWDTSTGKPRASFSAADPFRRWGPMTVAILVSALATFWLDIGKLTGERDHRSTTSPATQAISPERVDSLAESCSARVATWPSRQLETLNGLSTIKEQELVPIVGEEGRPGCVLLPRGREPSDSLPERVEQDEHFFSLDDHVRAVVGDAQEWTSLRLEAIETCGSARPATKKPARGPTPFSDQPCGRAYPPDQRTVPSSNHVDDGHFPIGRHRDVFRTEECGWIIQITVSRE